MEIQAYQACFLDMCTFTFSFCIETLCFATVYLFVGLYYLSAISNLLPLYRVLYLQKMALITDFCP